MKKLFLLLVAVLAIGLCASAQTRTVQGTVVDDLSDEELIGVSIQVVGDTKYNAVTDVMGNFSIKVPATAKTLAFSYIGFKPLEVPITDNMQVRMVSDNEVLGDVIVTAYGKQTRSSFTGSAATVGSAAIEKTQVTNVLDALAGKVPGLQLSNASGSPGGSDPTIRVRGISSIMAGNDPLIIVDGSPYTGDINSLNTNDIESMSVLKDAASNALYGARGANGVIIITTKRAKLGEAVVTVDAKWGANSRASQDYDYITDPREYYEQYYKALYNYATYPKHMYTAPTASNAQNIGGLGYSPEYATQWANSVLCSSEATGLGYQIFTVPQGEFLIGYNGKMNPSATLGYLAGDYWITPDDWMKETFKTSLRQEYNVNISQGTERSNVMASISYLDNQGIVNAPSDYRRFTGRLNADFQAKSWLKVGANVSYSNVNANSNASSGEGNSASTGNVFAAATQIAPIYPMYMRDAKGNIIVDDLGITRYDYGAGLNAGMRRPILSGSNALSDAILGVDKNTQNSFNGTGFIEIRLPYDFTFTSNNNIGLVEQRATSMVNPYYGQYATVGGTIAKQHVRNTDYTFQQLLNWNHTYGQHNVSGLLGHEYYKTKYEYLTGSKSNLFLPSNDELAGAITDQSPESGSSMYNNEGWFARAMYDYDNKYFASGSFRRDASSRFHPSHRWGSFWSLGGAWIISKEDFFDVDWVNVLKFKVSYGEQGNDNIGSFRYVDTYSLINANGSPAASPSSKGNPNISWEKNGNLNAGVEFELFNARLTGQIEGFYRTTHDMLMSFPLPASTGFMGYYANVGNMMNAGVEVELQGTVIRTRDFVWNLGFNFTWYKNKITKLPEERKGMEVDGYKGFQGSGIYYGEGLPMYTLYSYRYAGVDKETGLALYYKRELDDNGNPTGNLTTTHDGSQADQFLIKGILAPIYGGINTSFEYKGFDLSAAFNYQIGGKVNDSNYASLMGVPTTGNRGTNIHKDMANAWTPENPNSDIPRFVFDDDYTTMSSDRFMTDASYFSIENINFGYTLPKNIVEKLQLSRLRVYFAADNVWVFSKRKGLDPRQSMTGGVNNTYYAPIRTLSGGLTVTF